MKHQASMQALLQPSTNMTFNGMVHQCAKYGTSWTWFGLWGVMTYLVLDESNAKLCMVVHV